MSTTLNKIPEDTIDLATSVAQLPQIIGMSECDRIRLHILFIFSSNGISIPCAKLRNSLADRNATFESEAQCIDHINALSDTARGIFIDHLSRHLNNALGNLHI